MLHAIAAVLSLYVIIRLILPLRLPFRLRLLLSLLTLPTARGALRHAPPLPLACGQW